MTKFTALAALALIANLATTACSSSAITAPSAPTAPVVTPAAAPVAGWLTVAFTTPATDDGALRATIAGATVDSVRLVGTQGVAAVKNGEARLVITGTLTSGTVAQI